MTANTVPSIKVPPLKHNVTQDEFLASIFYIPKNSLDKPVSYLQDPVTYEAWVVDREIQRSEALFTPMEWFGGVVFLAHLKRFVSFWEAAQGIKGGVLLSSNLRLRRSEEHDREYIEVSSIKK